MLASGVLVPENYRISRRGESGDAMEVPLMFQQTPRKTVAVCGACRPLLPLVILLALGPVARPRAHGGEFDPVFYELREGSELLDDCGLCDRAAIAIPVRGTLVLTRLRVRVIGELYRITELDLETATIDPPISIRGGGSYHRVSDDITRLFLEVTIGETGGIELTSGDVAPRVRWPELDVAAEEQEIRDPFHFYRLRLVAAPRKDAVLYELVPGERPRFTGSFFTDDCTVCGAPTIPIPVGGRFLLVPESVGGPNPFDFYRVAALEVIDIEPQPPVVRITGRGKYTIGGEVALLQQMTLDVDVEVDDASVATVLESDRGPLADGERFPKISIGLRGDDPTNEIRAFTLQLVARPAEELHLDGFYRRGDVNNDQRVDLSDAVYNLVWLFAGGLTPPCLDAADIDADGVINLTDAVTLLDYLFRSGPTPPEPGPRACGVGGVVLGCEASSCGA